MIIVKTIAALRQILDHQRNITQTIGFVPTMGALHPGHLSLIETSRKLHPFTVCSIFVNPTQFNDHQDFDKYPVTIDKDCLLLEQHQTDVLFLPSVVEMYPDGLGLQKPHYDLGHLEMVLDGAHRPGHFQGVCQVVERLLRIVQPDELFLGQKDFQQCLVIKKLVGIMEDASSDLSAQWPAAGLKVNISPTFREPDGLAMSSRNARLSESARQIAPAIFQQMMMLKDNFLLNDAKSLITSATQNLLNAGFTKVDYVEIANAATLELLDAFDANIKMVVLAAAFLGDVRLIDNLLIN